MNFIKDFYKSLETLDLIIFWGIIIVIILLLIFSVIMMSKNNKLKKILNKKNEKKFPINNDELPIKKDNTETQLNSENDVNNELKVEKEIILQEIPQIKNNENNNEENITETIQTEKKFIAEEHVMEYNNDLFSIPNIKKTNQELDIQKEQNQEQTNNIKKSKSLEMPTGPYQRNVLREMSLGQTSPIGITTPKKKDDKRFELAKDLENALNNEEFESEQQKKELTPEETISLIKKIPKNTQKYKDETNEKLNINQYNEEQRNKEYKNNNIEIKENTLDNNVYTNKTIQKELSSIQKPSPRRTEIKKEEPKKDMMSIEDKIIDYQKIERTYYDNPNYQRKNDEQKITKQETSEERKISSEEITSRNNESKLSNKIDNKYQKTNSPNEKNLNNYNNNSPYYRETYQSNIKQENKEIIKNTKEMSNENIDPTVKELLNSVSTDEYTEKKNRASEKYLEEVSRKLAEADIQDEIERTDYELEQEENAIISYKELMEKKDSIQTIDEEEAVISIEELMNRNNKKQEPKEIDNKLYNLTDDEENDDFINELKQFRNDL